MNKLICAMLAMMTALLLALPALAADFSASGLSVSGTAQQMGKAKDDGGKKINVRVPAENPAVDGESALADRINAEIDARVAAKTADPAVIVADDCGRHVVSLLSGHIGGANRLTRQIAARIGAEPVVTTATDVNQRFSIDEWAARRGLSI